MTRVHFQQLMSFASAVALRLHAVPHRHGDSADLFTPLACDIPNVAAESHRSTVF
ncbi:MAG: hypothetical protein ACJ8LN_01500 [Sulfurifustis sp.]